MTHAEPRFPAAYGAVEGELGSQRLHVPPAAEAPHRDLKRRRRSVLSQRDHFTIENQVARLERADRFDDLGHGAGDVVQVARVHGDAVVASMHLNARAIQLPLHRDRLLRLQRVRDRGSRVGEHRLNGPEQLGLESRQLGVAVIAESGPRNDSEVAGQHGSASDHLRGHAGSFRHRVHHHSLERALPHFADS